MEEGKLDQFRQRLLARRRSLGERVQRSGEYGRETDQNVADIGDMAVESYTREILFGMSADDRRVLQLVAEALVRIEDRSYGTCTHCESEIQVKRLEAVPWTPLCIRCQQLQEQGLLQD